jgi:hypothetical protein
VPWEVLTDEQARERYRNWRDLPSMDRWPEGPITLNGRELPPDARLRLRKDRESVGAFLDGTRIEPGTVVRRGGMVVWVQPPE